MALAPESLQPSNQPIGSAFGGGYVYPGGRVGRESNPRAAGSQNSPRSRRGGRGGNNQEQAPPPTYTSEFLPGQVFYSQEQRDQAVQSYQQEVARNVARQADIRQQRQSIIARNSGVVQVGRDTPQAYQEAGITSSVQNIPPRLLSSSPNYSAPISSFKNLPSKPNYVETRTEFINRNAQEILQKNINSRAETLKNADITTIKTTPGAFITSSTDKGIKFKVQATPEDIQSAKDIATQRFNSLPIRDKTRSLIAETSIGVARGLQDIKYAVTAEASGPLALAVGGIPQREVLANRQIGAFGQGTRLVTGLGLGYATGKQTFKITEENLFNNRVTRALEETPSRTVAREISRNKEGESTFFVASNKNNAIADQTSFGIAKGKPGGKLTISGQTTTRFKDVGGSGEFSAVDVFSGGVTPTREVTGGSFVTKTKPYVQTAEDYFKNLNKPVVYRPNLNEGDIPVEKDVVKQFFNKDIQGNFGRGYLDIPGEPIKKFPVASVSKRTGNVITEVNLKPYDALGLESGGAKIRGKVSGKTTIYLLEDQAPESSFKFVRGTKTRKSPFLIQEQQLQKAIFGTNEVIKNAPKTYPKSNTITSAVLSRGGGAEARMLTEYSLFRGTGQYEYSDATGLAFPKQIVHPPKNQGVVNDFSNFNVLSVGKVKTNKEDKNRIKNFNKYFDKILSPDKNLFSTTQTQSQSQIVGNPQKTNQTTKQLQKALNNSFIGNALEIPFGSPRFYPFDFPLPSSSQGGGSDFTKELAKIRRRRRPAYAASLASAAFQFKPIKVTRKQYERLKVREYTGAETRPVLQIIDDNLVEKAPRKSVTF